MVVAATTTKTSVYITLDYRLFFNMFENILNKKHKRPLATAVQPTIVARYTHYTPVIPLSKGYNGNGAGRRGPHQGL